MELAIVLLGWVVMAFVLAPIVGRSLRPLGLVAVPPRPDIPIRPGLVRP